jgi:DNA polymerase (family 10)
MEVGNWLWLAIGAGVLLSINTDAHSTQELPHIDYGLAVARRAWATAENVINCMKLAELKQFLGCKR